MFGISFAELFVIFLLVLVVLGPEKLPEVARWMGKAMRQLRQTSNTLRDALEMEEFDAIDSSPQSPSQQSPVSPAESSPTPTPDSPTTANQSDLAADPPPGGLDQIDDDSFERLIDRRVEVERVDVRRVAIDPAVDSDDIDPVDLAEADPSGVELYDVALPPSVSSEAA